MPTKSRRRFVQSLEIGWNGDVAGHSMSVRTEFRRCCVEFGAAPAGDDDGGALVDEALCRR